MSVYTTVPREALVAFLASHGAGELIAYQGIADGVENTNYFVDTSDGRFVLTVFERLEPGALPFYLGLMAHLAAAGVACPAPVADRHGALSALLCGKPAALVSRLAGRPVDTPTAAHCACIGDWLAGMHTAAASFPGRLANPRGAAWRAATAAALDRRLAADERPLLVRELAVEQAAAPALAGLPRGIVHADLFRDNALFTNDAPQPRLGGVIDFYFAGADCLLFDLAVTANDWCRLPSGQLDAARTGALLAAYHARRPLEAAEQAAWPTLLRIAALRFWLSRLADLHLPREGDLVKVKDPSEYRRILEACHAEPVPPWLPG